MKTALKWALYLSVLVSPPGWAQSGHPWVLVDTSTYTIEVLQGDNIIKEFHNISLGVGGVSAERVADDNKTPLGIFHVTSINKKSRFHIFFGLDYPSLAQAKSAYYHNVIDFGDYSAIQTAALHGRQPPQDTALGGHIGIHGLGRGKLWIHNAYDWTKGCIALTNGQVDELSKWVDIGTLVVIR